MRLDAATSAFTIFAFLWALAILFHQFASPERHNHPLRFVLTFAALSVLLRPSSVPRVACLAAAQLGMILYFMPLYVTNHSLFTGFVNATILLALGYLMLVRRNLEAPQAELFRTFAPAVRVELLILYFYAVLHKLNTDFFAGQTSCAVDHYLSIAALYPILPTGPHLYPLLIYGTLVIEAAIPLLLVFRRTRPSGVLLGMAFHSLLALNPAHRFFNFSAMVFAVYFLFLPFDYRLSLRALAERFSAGQWILRLAGSGAIRWATLWFIGLSAAILFALLAIGIERSLVAEVVRHTSRVVYVIYALIALTALLFALHRWNLADEAARIHTFRIRPAFLVLMPMVVLLNGLSPYLGLKTETSFAMFSNLRTEAGLSNHLFMPQIRLWRYQDDLVAIIDTDIDRLGEIMAEGQLLPFMELRRRVQRHPDGTVTYVRNGERRVVDRVGNDPELSAPMSLLERKFLRFRPIDPLEQGFRCVH